MNAGKSTSLLQSNHNYKVRNLKTFIFTPKVDAQHHQGKIHSRLGVQQKANVFDESFDFFTFFKDKKNQKIACILVDEAQFLTEKQVWELSDVVEILNIPVMCFGLRTDFQGKLFEGSSSLLAIADELKEIKTICHCGKKANMVVRVDSNGKVLKEGAQLEIGGNEKYISLCRKHWKNEMENNR